MAADMHELANFFAEQVGPVGIIPHLDVWPDGDRVPHSDQ